VRSFIVGGQVQFFKAYAPRLFCKLRNHFGLSYESFVRQANVSVEGMWNCGDFFFSSKSAVCFKRIKSDERKQILEILLEYDKHMAAHPFSLLPQWYGLYQLTQAGGETMDFLACNDVFHTIDTIEILYDIKGCWTRQGSMEERVGRLYINPIGNAYDRRYVA
jgi:1-phosphatidylinositol-4-phosphate 5-kinase